MIGISEIELVNLFLKELLSGKTGINLAIRTDAFLFLAKRRSGEYIIKNFKSLKHIMNKILRKIGICK